MKNKKKKIISSIIFLFIAVFVAPKMVFAKWGVKTEKPFIDFSDPSNPVVTLNGTINNSDRHTAAAFRWTFNNPGNMSADCGSWDKKDYTTNDNLHPGKGDVMPFSYVLPLSAKLGQRFVYCAEARKCNIYNQGCDWKQGDPIILTIDQNSYNSLYNIDYSNTIDDIGNGLTVEEYIPLSTTDKHDVKTIDAIKIKDTEAFLEGSFNPNNVSTSGYFRYSTVSPSTITPIFCNDIYGSDMQATGETLQYQGTTNVPFSKKITNLLPNTTYYYCAIASEKNAIEGGTVKSFTTNIAGDSSENSTGSVSTKNPLVVNSTSVYLNGSYNSNYPSDTWFEYRKKTSINSLSGTSVANLSLSAPNLVTPSYTLSFKPNTSTTGTFNSNSLSTANLANEKYAQTSSASNDKISNGWTKVGAKSHIKGSGDFSFLLTGLTPGQEYQYRAVIKNNFSKIGLFGTAQKEGVANIYGNALSFATQGGNDLSPEDLSNNTNNGNENNYNNINTNPDQTQVPHTLGEHITPSALYLVGPKEGIETVFARQIIDNTTLAKAFGYTEDKNLQSFAWTLADQFAKSFGYVNSSGKELRVSRPNIAAYELQYIDGKLTVYEYYNSKIVNIQKYSSSLRSKYGYEYYFHK